MSAPPTSPKRRKRSAQEAREEALTAARALLLEGGPNAVTIAAVGSAIGTSHGNVLHHFGSAAALQSALMAQMVEDLTTALEGAVAQIRSDAAMPRQLTDLVFDAFDTGGAGHLAAWIMLSHEDTQLEPVRLALHDLIAAVDAALPYTEPGQQARIRKAVLLLSLCAFGDAVIGPPLRDMLGAGDTAGRELVSELLIHLLSRETD